MGISKVESPMAATYPSTNKCAWQMVDVCMRQDTSGVLNLDVCNCCIKAREEKHAFEIKKTVKQIFQLLELHFGKKFQFSTEPVKKSEGS